MLAVALFAAEVKVTSYGLLTVGGLVSMILGAMMLMRVSLRTVVLDVPPRKSSPATTSPSR